jgi:DNA helicase TIP49 (TBP-interacting protein)
MVRDLAELTPPPGREADVEEFLRLGAGMNDAAEEFVAGVRAGDVVAAQSQIGRLKRLGRSFDNSAIGLGATTCAEGASLSDSTLAAG